MTSRPYSFSGISTPEEKSSSGVRVVEEAQAARRRSTVAEHTIMAASRIFPPPPLRTVGQYPARESLPQAENGPTIRALIEFVGGASRGEASRRTGTPGGGFMALDYTYCV